MQQTRRHFIQKTALAASGFSLFNIGRAGPSANERVSHASFGASGMAARDINNLTRHKHLDLVAVAEIDDRNLPKLLKKFPEVRVYKDWRELLDKEHKHIDSVNVSTPDHMHAPMGIASMQLGLNVYGQKPLAHTLHETKRMMDVAAESKVVTQMGIQVASSTYERLAAQMIQDGVIGKVSEVHMFCFKTWGDDQPLPSHTDPIPSEFDWNRWLGPAPERNYIEGYYHPKNWRKRLGFGTGTLGDMGCHLYSPMFQALKVRLPLSVKSTGNQPNATNWALDEAFEYTFSGNEYTAGDTVKVYWTDGAAKPPKGLTEQFGNKMPAQGSIFVGTDGVLLQPHQQLPIPYPREKYQDYRYPRLQARNHYLDYVEAVLGKDVNPIADFVEYGGPLTETVLLGGLASHFPEQSLEWDSKNHRIRNFDAANKYLSKEYRAGWEV
ncbi:MAG: Gfo/Idh/MocA family protein [Opitutales bacterium]